MVALKSYAVADSQEAEIQSAASFLNRRFEGVETETVLRTMFEALFRDKIALVSSFGAESAVLLHLVSRIAPDAPILVIDTGKLFGETKRYWENLTEKLGLTGLRVVKPDEKDIAEMDPDGGLWARRSQACCNIRKVRPLGKALDGFDAWISGRKKYQSSGRNGLQLFEADNEKIKINPLYDWTVDRVKLYALQHDLPPHPLVEQGFLSIGCTPCTDRVAPGEDARAGRWRGEDKTECGIHLPSRGAQD
ncbi:MAG: phosphoadenylyl-sulfate reductase [Stappiaceae bacterium]